MTKTTPPALHIAAAEHLWPRSQRFVVDRDYPDTRCLVWHYTKTDSKAGRFRAHLIVYLYLHDLGFFSLAEPVFHLASGRIVSGSGNIIEHLYGGNLKITLGYLEFYRTALDVVREKQPHDDSLLPAVLDIVERGEFEFGDFKRLGEHVQKAGRGRSRGWKMALGGDDSLQTTIQRFQKLQMYEEFRQLMRLFPEQKRPTAVEMAVTCPWDDVPPLVMEMWKRHHHTGEDETYKCLGKAVGSCMEEDFVTLARHGRWDQEGAEAAGAAMVGCARAVGGMMCTASQDEAARDAPLVTHLAALMPEVIRLNCQQLSHHVKLLTVSPERSELLSHLASSVLISLVDALQRVDRGLLDKVCCLLPSAITTAFAHVIKRAREDLEQQQQQQQEESHDVEQGEVGEKRESVSGHSSAASNKAPRRQNAREVSLDAEEAKIPGLELLSRAAECVAPKRRGRK